MYRLFSGNPKAENDHVPLSPFFPSRIAEACARGPSCCCSAVDGVEANLIAPNAPSATGTAAMEQTGDATGNAARRAGAEQEAAATTIPEGSVPGCPRGDVQDSSRAMAAPGTHHDGHPAAPSAVNGHRGVDNYVGDALERSPRPVGARVDANEQADLDGSDTSDAEVLELSDDSDVEERVAAGANMPTVDASALWEDAEARLGVVGKRVEWVSTLPLTKVQRQFVANLTAGVDSARPVRPRNKANIVLLVADFLRLHGERWLNGELMNSVIVMINDKQQRLHAAKTPLDVEELDVEELEAEAPANLRSCMFGTYFFSRLVPVAVAYDYDGVRRWGAGVRLDLSAVDVILVPINVDGSHWVLVQVNVQDQFFLFYDPFGTKDNQGYVNAVLRWLIDELRATVGQGAVAEWAVDK